MRKHDDKTGDLFIIPQPVAPIAGALCCRVEVAHVMAEALREHDRYEVAAQMSKLLGTDITKNMLDAYCSESREEHHPSFERAIAFDMATGTHALANLMARKLGAKLAVGKDALNSELGKLERQRDEAANKIKALKRQLGEAE